MRLKRELSQRDRDVGHLMDLLRLASHNPSDREAAARAFAAQDAAWGEEGMQPRIEYLVHEARYRPLVLSRRKSEGHMYLQLSIETCLHSCLLV